ncbi:NHS-like protein 2 [Ictalurus punctatus]|uniref:NHS-like protein 2 n=1 Tax=Ictalurus punctatus TaxID=7998 RepID=A0A2D0SYM9_ICTPU|nr:NHS-like protein 2 [Ictalurus punctatus]XP_017347638.1 NHS-like protein 2 [Ictalurus punctatus]XP_017347639.1 NHS-like protein 2 [Ictalurus punctatus]
MEHTTLFCPSQTWKGPNVSTFSSEWDDTLNSYLLAPDVIKPPPQFQDPEEPCQATPTNVAVIRKRDKDAVRTGAMQKERRSRPVSAMEHHRRSLSLSTAITSNPGATRRRCESYALSYPSSSSDDSGSDSTSVRRGDRLPDAVPQHKARSIVLRKAKRKPAPPARTVSLPRLTDVPPPERRTQSLYIPNDAQNATLLPDLIPLSKEEAGDSGKTTLTLESPGDVPVNQAISSHRPLKELRSSEPCKSSTSSSVGYPLNEPAKVPCNSDCNNSPSSSRSSPSQPSISSPSKPPGSASPSSGYSSQCETPTQSTAITTGAGRMRPKPSGAVPGQQVRNCRSRLSLQLPETQAVNPNPEPSVVLPKVNRRYSDASHPKQRLSNSMLIMPVVTQEDLNKVRLRSVSSSDLDTTAVIEEENEKDAGSVAAQNSPKNKPPVAPKPPVSKRPPCAAAVTNSSTTSAADPTVTNANYGQNSIYSTVNKVKPKVVLPSSSNASNDHKQKSQEHMKETSRFQSQCSTDYTHALSFKPATDAKPSEPQKKRRAPAPPVSKRPNTVHLPHDNMSVLDKHVQSPYSKPESSQREYHVTVYGLIPTYSQVDEKVPPPEYELYDKEDGQVSEIGALHLVNEEDEVFLHKPSSHTTEDLFTIIHRSKRKLLGRKDSLDNKQGDFGTHTLGGVSKSTYQNDNFMALLRRTRSAKASCGSRISAAELLRSSKPAAPAGSTDLTSYKKHNVMQSHAP